MTVKELIEKLQLLPEDYTIAFESGDLYGYSYMVFPDDIIVNVKYKLIELRE